MFISALLVLIAACDQSETNTAKQADSSVSHPAFTDVSQAVNLNFIHDNGATGKFYMPEIMGSGSALFDADGDGDLDLYLVQGGAIEDSSNSNSKLKSDVLLRNDLSVDSQGNATFRLTDMTESAGIPSGGYGMGVITGDINGDGHVDLYISNLGPNRLLLNKGDGTFEDITEQSGTGGDKWSVPAAFIDIDADGDLDLYSGTYVNFRLSNHRDCFSSTGLPDYCSPHSYSAVGDKLYQNQGDGTFKDISASSGLRAVPSKALGAISGDFNHDGKADLYIANDGVANQLWINQGNGRFEDTALFAGCAVNYEGSPEASMGVAAADIDADGDEDIFMTHLRGETNTLYLNHGDGSFEDKTIRLGLAGPSIPYTGFGTAWLDVENDGKLDLLAVNGAVTVEEQLVQKGDNFPYHQPNQLFKNVSTADKLLFEPYRNGQNGGEDDPFAASYVSRGAALGDLDNDGDLDLVITNNSGPARVLLNQLGQNQSWLGLEPRLGAQGGIALGAMVTLNTPSGTQTHRVRSAGSYASANDPRVIFGLNKLSADHSLEVVVEWPGGNKEQFGPLSINQYHTLILGTGRPARAL